LLIGIYKIIAIKLKISYEAARREISVLELFLEAIHKVYKQRLKDVNLHELAGNGSQTNSRKELVKFNKYLILEQFYEVIENKK